MMAFILPFIWYSISIIWFANYFFIQTTMYISEMNTRDRYTLVHLFKLSTGKDSFEYIYLKTDSLHFVHRPYSPITGK